MDGNDTPTIDAGAPVPAAARSLGKGKRSRKSVEGQASDHVPAILAATTDGPAPVVEAPVFEPSPVIEAAAPIAPAVDLAPEPEAMPLAEAPVDPVPETPPAAVSAVHAKESTMDTVETTTATFGQNANDAAARGQAMLAEFNTRAKDAMEKGKKMFEEMNQFSKGNVEALVESSKIAVKGFEALGQDAAELARRQFEGASEAMKTLASTKSPTEFLKLQGDYARSLFDTMVAETSRSTEKMIKLANDVAQPISNRVALAAEKVKVAA